VSDSRLVNATISYRATLDYDSEGNGDEYDRL